MRIFGIPVSVDLSFFMIAVLLGASRLSQPALLAQWVAVVFVAVVVHEFGHALAGRAFGLSPKILLYGMGGVTTWEEGRPLTPVRSILVSLAGPFAGFALAAVWLVAQALVPALDGPVLAQLGADILWVTVAWGVFNLLPVLPLDGGNVVRGALEWIFGRPADRAAHAISIVVAGAVAVLALLGGYLFGAFFAIYFGWSNVSALKERSREDRDVETSGALDRAWAEIEAGRGAGAIDDIRALIGSAQARATRQRASEALAYAQLQADDVAAAQRSLGAYQAEFGRHPYLDATVRLAAGDGEGAAALLAPIYEKVPGVRVGRDLCRAYTRSGRDDAAFAVCEAPEADRYAASLYGVIAEEAFRGGRFETAARAAGAAFDRSGDPKMAYNAACAHARAGDVAAALAWLDRAAERGFADVELLEDDDDLDVARAAPEFGALRRRIAANRPGSSHEDSNSQEG